jgi:hypothetical protein
MENTMDTRLQTNVMGGTNVVVYDERGTVHVVSYRTASNARRSIRSGACLRMAAKYGRDA